MSTEKYRPSCNDEADGFFISWCQQCARDKAMREGISVDECDANERCDLIANAFMCDIEDPLYPVEWIYKDGRPTCTAFIPAGEKVPERRCAQTIDMFPEE